MIASLIGSTGAKQASVPSSSSHHSSRVLVLNTAVSRWRSAGHLLRSVVREEGLGVDRQVIEQLPAKNWGSIVPIDTHLSSAVS